ncbi:MAG: hypothetical protein UY95_C0019G0011 [Parcubacteria group bacterium GW2011_GWA2_56_7]|nr:MAG: hypothetical protein UY95_C0019G0011 [Parcubacteria group bacterium GW2011_GWA2_56_7]
MSISSETLLAIDTGLGPTATAAGYGNVSTNIPVIVGNLLSAVLGLLGIAFLIFLIWGGILWLTAAGDKTKIEKAQRTIINSALAVVVIVAAYAISTFVVERLIEAVSSS